MDIRKTLIDACGRLMVSSVIDKIPVSAILREAGVSRATFYKYFPDKYTLAADVLVKSANIDIYPYAPYAPLTLEHFVRVCRDMVVGRDFILRIYSDPLLLERMAQGIQEVYEQRYAYVYGPQSLTPKVRMAIDYAVHGYVKLNQRWVNEGMTLPPETFAEWLFEFMASPYFV